MAPGGEPDFALSSETPDVAPSSDTREAMSVRPGGYVGQAAFQVGSSVGWQQAAPGNDRWFAMVPGVDLGCGGNPIR
jgi:hypothetical protein